MVIYHHVNAFEENGHVIFDVIGYDDASLYDMFYLKKQKDKPESKGWSMPVYRRYALPLHVDSVRNKTCTWSLFSLHILTFRAILPLSNFQPFINTFTHRRRTSNLPVTSQPALPSELLPLPNILHKKKIGPSQHFHTNPRPFGTLLTFFDFFLNKRDGCSLKRALNTGLPLKVQRF